MFYNDYKLSQYLDIFLFSFQIIFEFSLGGREHELVILKFAIVDHLVIPGISILPSMFCLSG